MTRETRLNLIFLAILLAILTPGAVILFHKKLQPTIKPMGTPEAVQREVAYMSPGMTPPGKTRVEPPQTARWIEALVRDRIGEPRTLADDHRQITRPTDPDGLPLMSDRKSFQLVAAEPLESEIRLWLLLWDYDPAREETWSVKLADAEQKFRIVDTRPVEVPPIVRDELGETGITRPPHEVVWQELVIPKSSDGTIRLQRGSPSGADYVHFVPSFTNSGATRH
jgi:hypothetical protein